MDGMAPVDEEDVVDADTLEELMLDWGEVAITIFLVCPWPPAFPNPLLVRL